jgi:hypothetical protein
MNLREEAHMIIEWLMFPGNKWSWLFSTYIRKHARLIVSVSAYLFLGNLCQRIWQYVDSLCMLVSTGPDSKQMRGLCYTPLPSYDSFKEQTRQGQWVPRTGCCTNKHFEFSWPKSHLLNLEGLNLGRSMRTWDSLLRFVKGLGGFSWLSSLRC